MDRALIQNQPHYHHTASLVAALLRHLNILENFFTVGNVMHDLKEEGLYYLIGKDN